MKYYLHRSLGVVADYFGEIGPEFEVCWLRFWLYRLLGFRWTIRSVSGVLIKSSSQRVK